jgi:hypothetical protein
MRGISTHNLVDQDGECTDSADEYTEHESQDEKVYALGIRERYSEQLLGRWRSRAIFGHGLCTAR